MIFVLNHSKGELLQIKRIEKLGHSIPVLRQDILNTKLGFPICSYFRKFCNQLEGNLVSVHMIVLVKAIYPIVLLDAADDEPALVRVQEEEGLPVDGVVQLSRLGDVEENIVYENS